MERTDRKTKPITNVFLALLAGATLFVKLAEAAGVRLFEDPITMTVLALVSARIHPTTVVGLFLLVLYLAVNELANLKTAKPLSPSTSNLLGIAIALVYVGLTLSLWIDPTVVAGHIANLIVGTSRLIYTSPFVGFIDPVAVRTLETALRAAVATTEETLLRSPDRPVHWPLYLFVSYVSISEIVELTSWENAASKPVRVSVHFVMAIIVLLYGLILGHNFFPGPDTLPWRSTTITVWLLTHTVISGVVLFVLRRTAAPRHTDSFPSTPTSLVVFLLLGMVVAVLNALSPLPELLMLGIAGVVLVGQFTSIPWADALSVELADIEAHFVESLATAWQHPTQLFPLLVVFQGFWWAGHLLWLMLFAIGGPLSGTNTTTTTLLLFIVAIFPLVAASVYSMAFWLVELHRRATDQTVPFARPLPDLLTTPTLVIASYLTANRLFEIHPIAGLLAPVGVFAGTYGMWRSVQAVHSGADLPYTINQYGAPLAFFVQASGFTLASTLSHSPYGTSGIPLLLLGTLGPLYFLPYVRQRGIFALSPSVAAPLLTAVTTVFATGYFLSVRDLSIFNGGFLAFAAVVLATLRINRDA